MQVTNSAGVTHAQGFFALQMYIRHGHNMNQFLFNFKIRVT